METRQASFWRGGMRRAWPMWRPPGAILCCCYTPGCVALRAPHPELCMVRPSGPNLANLATRYDRSGGSCRDGGVSGVPGVPGNPNQSQTSSKRSLASRRSPSGPLSPMCQSLASFASPWSNPWEHASMSRESSSQRCAKPSQRSNWSPSVPATLGDPPRAFPCVYLFLIWVATILCEQFAT